MESTITAFCLAVVTLTLVAAVVDWRTRRLPNWLTVPAFLAALLFHATLGKGILFALAGFGVGFGILLLLMMVGGGGGGDVKLMGAVGAWLGAKLILYVFVISALLIALVGGSVGAIAGQQYWRHKTRKEPFRSLLFSIFATQVIFLAWMVLQ